MIYRFTDISHINTQSAILFPPEHTAKVYSNLKWLSKVYRQILMYCQI